MYDWSCTYQCLIASWIVYPYVDGFLDGSGKLLVLPTYDVETVVCGFVPYLLYMHMDGRGLFKVLLASFPKGPCCLYYVLLIAGTGICRLPHFSCPLGPGPWVAPGLAWLLFCPWSKFVCHTYHMCFWNFLPAPVCMVWLHYPIVEFGLEMVVDTELALGLLLACTWLLLSPVCVCCSMLLVRLLLVCCRLLLLEFSWLLFKTYFVPC